MGLMSDSIILTFKMTLASAYTAITDAWVLSARGRKYNCKSIQVSTLVLVTAITKTKSPSEQAEVAITSLRGGLLIVCSIGTSLLALQVLELGFQLKNAHTQRHWRRFKTSGICLTFCLYVCLSLPKDSWGEVWKSRAAKSQSTRYESTCTHYDFTSSQTEGRSQPLEKIFIWSTQLRNEHTCRLWFCFCRWFLWFCVDCGCVTKTWRKI